MARRKESAPKWNWRDDLVSATLFLHLDGKKLSETDWERWVKAWRSYAHRIDTKHPGLAGYLGYAIGIARHDKHLMDLAFESISTKPERDWVWRSMMGSPVQRIGTRKAAG
jgi:hypothetical protein